MFQKLKHKYAHARASQKKIWLLTCVGIVLVFLIVMTALFVVRSHNKPTSSVSSVPESGATQVRDPLTGMFVDQVHANQQVYGVMIDEHVDARPQSGIDQAFLVIEAPVEAGIPRLLAFFSQDEKVDKIGPIRSARPYYVDWALEFGALYTHVGGSNEALDKITTGATFDLNQFWHDPQFWRSTDRDAPHNVYTSTDRLGAYVKAKQDAGRPAPLYGVWKFKTTKPEEVFPSRFTISYTNPDYVFSWGYDVAQKTYVRLFDDQIMKTKEGNEIHADNVAVVITDVAVIDTYGRKSVRTTGQGTAYVFQDGTKTEAIWKKPTASERLRFFNKDGTEMEMNPGHTWIEVIGDESQLNHLEP
ncbi:MAG: DUF3048 domain-containing protein [Candidatus Uhrbacteria bacterium]|nr:DUF3048 domain-containing protein [Candidatus Uhrbacteria bacterium]